MTASQTPAIASQKSFAFLFEPLSAHLQELDKLLKSVIEEFEPEIRELAEYCIDTSGKRIRPALVFFAGWQGREKILPALVRFAAVVELVHLATLVHDDIMDGAELRRSRLTATRAYGTEASVLLGDSLLAHAVKLAAQFPSPDICRMVAEATRRVCAGEIMQTLRRGHADLPRADYRRIIDLKTAELFRLSCEVGASLAGYPADFAAAAATFGRHLGIAYQIYDDLADFFGEEQRIGKTLGTDLANGKPTLPLLILLDRIDSVERTELIAELEKKLPPNVGLHIQQMAAHGIFAEVNEAIADELALATSALFPWQDLAPASVLRPMCELLRRQTLSLQPTAMI